MTSRARFVATTLGIGVAVGMWVRPPEPAAAQTPQAPPAVPGQRQPGNVPARARFAPAGGRAEGASSRGRSSSRARSSPARSVGTGSTCLRSTPGPRPPTCSCSRTASARRIRTGSLRVPQVLENLIHKKDIPVTIGIFITPGQRGDVYPETISAPGTRTTARPSTTRSATPTRASSSTRCCRRWARPTA